MADSHVLFGLGVALTASAAFETSYALQALEARSIEVARGPRPSLLLALARRRRWLGAIALAVVGMGLQILALGLAPLTLVQPALASGLILLLYLGVRVLGEHVGRREVAAAGAIVVGVSGIALAAPERSDAVSEPVVLGIVMGVLVLVAVAPYLDRRLGALGPVLVASTAAADIAAIFAAKLISDELGKGHVLTAVALVAGAAATVLLGLTSESAALQRLPATRVAPLVLVLQTLVPVLLAPVLLGESWGSTPLGGAVIAGSIALVGLGAAVLAASGAVAALDQVEHEGSGGG